MAVLRVVPRRSTAVRPHARRAVSRMSVRLWVLLHAQALLSGTPGGIHDAAIIEDDRTRLSRRP